VRSDILLFAEQQVHCPASTNVRPRAPEVAKDGLLGAACFLQRVGADRKPPELSRLVDPRCHRHAGTRPLLMANTALAAGEVALLAVRAAPAYAPPTAMASQ